jgi:hypothetical protein
MTTQRQSANRAAAVSRALSKAGFRPGKPSALAPFPALEVKAWAGGVTVEIDTTPLRAAALAVSVHEALTAAGYTATIRPASADLPGFILIAVAKEDWA